MSDVSKETEQLLLAMKQTSVYKNFEIQKIRMKEFPELKKQVDDFRMRNFELQSEDNNIDFFEAFSVFEKENADLRENPIVADFLSAELAICRMVQEVSARIINSVEIE